MITSGGGCGCRNITYDKHLKSTAKVTESILIHLMAA